MAGILKEQLLAAAADFEDKNTRRYLNGRAAQARVRARGPQGLTRTAVRRLLLLIKPITQRLIEAKISW